MQTRSVEVIRVAGPGFFVNTARQACRYTSAAGRPLAIGYYLALGPGRPGGTGRDAETRFYGPFATEAAARFLALSAQALGVTQHLARRQRPAPGHRPAHRLAADRPLDRRADATPGARPARIEHELRDGNTP
jgi:hypothetical protein